MRRAHSAGSLKPSSATCQEVDADLGMTPLHVAADNGHNAIVKYLLTEEIPVNAIDNFKCTPLHLAVGGRGQGWQGPYILVDAPCAW